MARAYRKWTDAERQTARTLYAEGKGYILIGRALGRHPNSVANFIYSESGRLNSMGKTCADCAKPIANRNTSGRCKSCCPRHMNADPAFYAVRVAACRASPNLMPGSQARKLAGKKSAVTRMANPEYVAWLLEFVRTKVAPASLTPESQARRDRKAAGQKLSQTLMGWCPQEYREAYFYLIRTKQLKRAEAKPIILAQIATDNARAEAKLSPFERQERALARGAKLIANDVGPMFGEAVKRA